MSITPTERPRKTRHASSAPPERDATPAEMRALANPIRLRLLRLTLDRALTNKEMAERLGRDPGTVLHHVRVLVRTGFLEAGKVRPASAVRWSGRIVRPASRGRYGCARAVTTRNQFSMRCAMRLSKPTRARHYPWSGRRAAQRPGIEDLRHRVAELGDEFVLRDDPAGTPMGILALLYKRRP